MVIISAVFGLKTISRSIDRNASTAADAITDLAGDAATAVNRLCLLVGVALIGAALLSLTALGLALAAVTR